MAFPESPRVVYRCNPLDEVSCQLRFPPILRIDAQPPADFQERIRDDFPLYESKNTIKLPGVPKEIAKVVERDIPIPGTKNHSFSSVDRGWEIRLSRDSLGLVCRKKYDRWENFRSRFEPAFRALSDLYRPAYFSHVCLKYRDVIRRESLQLSDVPWKELLNPWVSGPLADGNVGNDVEVVQTTVAFQLPNGLGKIQTTYGLAQEQPTRRNVFLIDAHLFSEPKTEPADVFNRLVALNKQARYFFRWCITDRLHHALQPGSVISD